MFFPVEILQYALQLILQHALHLLVYILSGVAEFLVEYLVWCRVTECLKAPDLGCWVSSEEEALEVDRESGCHAEYLCTCWDDALLIFERLVAEEFLRWSRHDTYLDAVLTEELGTADECRYL